MFARPPDFTFDDVQGQAKHLRRTDRGNQFFAKGTPDQTLKALRGLKRREPLSLFDRFGFIGSPFAGVSLEGIFYSCF